MSDVWCRTLLEPLTARAVNAKCSFELLYLFNCRLKGVSANLYVGQLTGHELKHTHTYTQRQTQTLTNSNAHTYTHAHISTPAPIHTYTHTHAHTKTHTHTNTHTHTYIHRYTPMLTSKQIHVPKYRYSCIDSTQFLRKFTFTLKSYFKICRICSVISQ